MKKRTPQPSPGAEAASLAVARGTQRVSVCIPARDEERTIGAIVGAVHRDLTAAGAGVDLVDELIVVDDGSSDSTAKLARQAGAEVVSPKAVHGHGGKGRAMAAGAAHCTGDIVVFLDGDVVNFTSHFVTALVAPLVNDESVMMVKAFYRRPLDGAANGGGRVTELMAKPAISLLFPELAFVEQPLAGETALRRRALDSVVLEPGYGVEIGLLVDVAELFGTQAIAQVDLGMRAHRNRPLDELRPQATDVLSAALARSSAILSR